MSYTLSKKVLQNLSNQKQQVEDNVKQYVLRIHQHVLHTAQHGHREIIIRYVVHKHFNSWQKSLRPEKTYTRFTCLIHRLLEQDILNGCLRIFVDSRCSTQYYDKWTLLTIDWA